MGNVNFTGVLYTVLSLKESFVKSFQKKILRIYCRYLGLMIRAIWKINQVEFYVTDHKKLKSWKDQTYVFWKTAV